MTWLITGGAGYIGSHVVKRLRETGRDVVVLDDLSAGNVNRVPAGVPVVKGNLCDRGLLAEAMAGHHVDGVVNLAARKSVPESVAQPLWYYRENLGGFIALLDAMAEVGVTRLVQSSSAAIYGDAGPVLDEDTPTVPLSPYARTKLMAEQVLVDSADSTGLSYLALRYFNPVGAVAPALAEVGGTNIFALLFSAIDAGRPFGVTGADYDTRDGSGLRDYLHIADLADAHVAAASYLDNQECREIVNIGTGIGYTVFELLDMVREVTGLPVPHEVVARRPGDPAGAVASVTKAERLLGWRAHRDLRDMVDSAWRMWRQQRDG